MTTPAALVPALPAATPTSSIEAAASLAIAATSSSNATKPPGMRTPRAIEPTQRAGSSQVAMALQGQEDKRERIDAAYCGSLDLGEPAHRRRRDSPDTG